jgi:hypothetical protein
MIAAQDLQDSMAGRPAAILGGGPSLPADLQRVPPGSLLISVNQHALRLVKADYLVFLDQPQQHPALYAAVQSFDGPRVTRIEAWADILIGSETAWWIKQLSGHVATWFGCWIGCEPVLLCGMDCYQGEQHYFYEREFVPRSWTQHTDLDGHIKGWAEVTRRGPHPERIRAMSGPLVDLFGEYKLGQ